jgi:hypothetical protein
VPTRPGFDVIPLRKETKARLAQLKGEGSYDELLRRLLEAGGGLPPGATDAPPSKPRAPDEQVALARLAAWRWQDRVRGGRIVELGPRLFVYRTGAKPRRSLDVEWSGRRGFSP